jgi:hypothetical protein
VLVACWLILLERAMRIEPTSEAWEAKLNPRFPARPHPFTLQRERASGKALTFLPGMREMSGNLG